MILFAFWLLIITWTILTLAMMLLTPLSIMVWWGHIRPITHGAKKILSLAVISLLLVGTTLLLSLLAKQIDNLLIDGSKTGLWTSVMKSPLSETTASSSAETQSWKPTSTTTTTLMYVRIYEEKVYIHTPASILVYGIEQETVPSLVSFVEEHGLELNTHSIQTEDGIWFVSKTPYDFFGLLSRLRPWLSQPLEQSEVT